MWWIFITLFVLALALEKTYEFLPKKFKNAKWLKTINILALLTIFLHEVYEPIQSYRNRIYAVVNLSGNIIDSNNFPWKITRATGNGKAVYLINEKLEYTDVSAFTVNPSKTLPVRSAFGGTAVEFDTWEHGPSEFRIEIKR